MHSAWSQELFDRELTRALAPRVQNVLYTPHVNGHELRKFKMIPTSICEDYIDGLISNNESVLVCHVAFPLWSVWGGKVALQLIVENTFTPVLTGILTKHNSSVTNQLITHFQMHSYVTGHSLLLIHLLSQEQGITVSRLPQSVLQLES